MRRRHRLSFFVTAVNASCNGIAVTCGCERGLSRITTCNTGRLARGVMRQACAQKKEYTEGRRPSSTTEARCNAILVKRSRTRPDPYDVVPKEQEGACAKLRPASFRFLCLEASSWSCVKQGANHASQAAVLKK